MFLGRKRKERLYGVYMKTGPVYIMLKESPRTSDALVMPDKQFNANHLIFFALR